MKNWQADLLRIVGSATGEQEIFDRIMAAAHELGFEYCAYGVRLPLPLSNPKILTLFHYPSGWTERYHAAGYVSADPTVLHGRRSQEPVIWSDELFAPAKQMWDEAQSFGIRVGWAQSTLINGVVGMLTLARSFESLSAKELEAKEPDMRWLVSTAHLALIHAVVPKLHEAQDLRLTEREIEVLKWTADGKTASEIARILAISVDTVNFHVRNATAKLGTANKTAAVVKAAMLGWLN